MTAKKAGIDCTRGLSREQRATARRNKRESLLSSGSHGRGRRRLDRLERKIQKMIKLQNEVMAKRAEDYRVLSLDNIPDRVVSSTTFEERHFGYLGSPDEALRELGVMDDVTQNLSSIVVSLALFDGNRMLFACSGVAVPPGPSKLELTRFVTSSRLVREFSDNRNKDDQLRIEVCLPDNTHADGFLGLYYKDIAIVTSIDLDVDTIDLDLQAPLPSDGKIIAAGRAFKSGRLMVLPGLLTEEGLAELPDITEAGLVRRFVNAWNIFRFSRFMMKNKWLESMGYPNPPPLVLEFNGEMLYSFEEEFGELRAWRGYPYSVSNPDSTEYVWALLPRKVVTNISRSVVRLASFSGSVRSFACTGLLIKWPGRRGMRTVILTSASLVRSCDDEDKVDKNLKIDVFLPPGQHTTGTLVFYHYYYNIAIISVEKGLHGIRPINIFRRVQESSKEVVAIACQIEEGFLMASRGEVIEKPSELDCKELMLSTCKINKAGIGGPLINFYGTFVGMNFYDGSRETPFLPRSKIVEVLRREINHPRRSERSKKSRWPVPKPYWYHGLLQMYMYDLPPHIGRQLQ